MGKNKKKNQDANKEAVAIEPMAKVGVGEPKSISTLPNKNQKKKKMIEGVEQFDPNLNLANLFSGPVGSISKVVCNDKLTPVVAPIKLKNEKKERLNNKDAAEIRVRARAQMKFESQSSVDDGIVTNGLRKKTNKKSKKMKDAQKSLAVPVQLEDQDEEDDKNLDDTIKLEYNSDSDLTDSDNDENDTKRKDDEAKEQKSFKELNMPKPKNEELEKRTIFVGNVPKQLINDQGKHGKKELKRIFASCGTIESIRFRGVTAAKPTELKKVAFYRKDIHPDRVNVNVYIRFSNREEAEKAAKEKNGLKIHDHHLFVDLAAGRSTKRDNKKAVFVGNLPLDTKEEDLWSFFEDCGSIHSIRIVRDQATGLGKGFGYVNFENSDSVELALTKNEQGFNGRPIRLTRAVKKLKQKKTIDRNSTLRTGTGNKNSTNQLKQNGKQQQPIRRKFKQEFEKSSEFSGDRISEIGKLKRKANKVNRGDLKKASIAKFLQNKSSTRTLVEKPIKDTFKKNSTSSESKPKAKQSKARKGHSKDRAQKFKKGLKNPYRNGTSQGNDDGRKPKPQAKRYFSK